MFDVVAVIFSTYIVIFYSTGVFNLGKLLHEFL